MIKSKSSTEKEVLAILTKAVEEIESFTKIIGYEVLEKPLGFFFARVLDNKITRSMKGKLEYESAIIRAAAFLIVIQIISYILLFPEKDRIEHNIDLCQDAKDFQFLFDELIPNQQYNNIFKPRIIKLLPENSTTALKSVFKTFVNLQIQKFKGDILGKIFHGLIPFNLRKFLAAFYTSNIAGDFLARLAIKEVKHKILDPACGSGTLLVSAYNRLKELDEQLTHYQILQKLYGIDVSVFAAQLAVINLFLKEPDDTSQNAQIIIQDAFKIKPGSSNKNEKIKTPNFDVVLGNPPFTRGDRLDREYKDFLESHLRNQGISLNYNKKYLGLYAYFLLDSLRFLKKNGTLAFILPVSIINSYTMKPVLKFLLSKFSFKYIITSEAQITFSEQCVFKEILFIAQKGHKFKSKTKFVVLKEELSKKNLVTLAEKIEHTVEDYEDSFIQIRHISRQTLEETVEMNWMLYLYNETFYNLFEQIKHLEMVSPITQLVETPRVDVDRGLRAGISNFFYLPNKYWVIQEENKNWIKIVEIKNESTLIIPRKNTLPVLRKSSLYNQIIPNISEFILVFPPESSSNSHVESYIQWGMKKFGKDPGFERLTYDHIRKRRKLAHIGITHELSLVSNKIIAYYYPENICLSDNFIFIRTSDEKRDKILAAYFNSSIFLLTYFVLRREKGGALGQIFGTDMRNFFSLDPSKINATNQNELFKIFDRFIQESRSFQPFKFQLSSALEDNSNIRYLLDKKICEILKIEESQTFLKQLYETLISELIKFI
ncbi:MAG: class I SAM-dependent DNA methyltransferase [Candidatus Hermodarchaeota archaeon]